ncbi:hypothetical protein D1013_09910 [Euzebyella marina]|uniref:Uncharacterized protein n=1 Tax=Euzebyella marina TaxID=1761453 RepID=A0A3G2L5W2_9FLAO|nr:hypothetical protein [Euzebyella marina]AYN67659.1 hypothetical protein D1013_09910 [Euzebyella marina]
MPANKKHLTQSSLHRILKITAGFFGGYAITQVFHMVLIEIWDSASTLITLRFAGFIVWATLLVCAFIPKNGFKIWGIYLAIFAVLALIVFINQTPQAI